MANLTSHAVLLFLGMAFSNASNAECLTLQQTLQTLDLSQSDGCSAETDLFISYFNDEITIAHPIAPELQLYYGTFGIFHNLRLAKERQLEYGVKINVDFELRTLELILLQHMRDEYFDSAINLLRYEAMIRLRSFQNASEADAAAYEALRLLSHNINQSLLTTIDAVCFWANYIPGAEIEDVMESERVQYCVKDKTYVDIIR